MIKSIWNFLKELVWPTIPKYKEPVVGLELSRPWLDKPECLHLAIYTSYKLPVFKREIPCAMCKEPLIVLGNTMTITKKQYEENPIHYLAIYYKTKENP